MGTFIGLWIAQLVFGAVVYFTNPKRDDISDKTQSSRKLAIYAGLVPCVGFMLFLQVIWLVIYRIALAREQSLHNRFQAGLQTSFGPLTRGSEAPQALPTNSPSKSQAENPFL